MHNLAADEYWNRSSDRTTDENNIFLKNTQVDVNNIKRKLIERFLAIFRVGDRTFKILRQYNFEFWI